ncbi:MAG: WcaI family glycosyltransferase, partial [Gallionella sp.]
PTLTIFRCPLWVPAKPSGSKRVLHLASFALSSFPVMLRQIFWRPDVVWVVEPALFCAPQAWLVARLSGGKAWLHVQDFEVDAAFDLGILKSSSLRRVVLALERWLMRRFDRVSTISDRMLEKLRSKGVESNKAILFSNWVDLAAIHPMREEDGFRRQLGISPDRIVALYSGNMGEKQGLEVVLKAAVRLQGSADVHFVLCGDGAAKARLHREYEALPNVTWLPLQPVDKLNELLNMADIHLLPQRGDAADLVMPSKLLGMLASGRPILATVLPDTQVAEVVSRCGVVTPPGDVVAFAEALQNLAADAEGRGRLGEAGRLIAEKQYSQGAVLHHFEQELKRVVHA